MNRQETLEAIRDNSRLNQSAPLGRFTIEHRIGYEGDSFILLDMSEHGFQLFYSDKSTKLTDVWNEFAERTNVKTDLHKLL